jgi:8-oxo-dGTP diphosphatase
VENREPEKCEVWEWFAVDQLPEKLFLPLAQLVQQKVSLIER